jgi:hypothetical protein
MPDLKIATHCNFACWVMNSTTKEYQELTREKTSAKGFVFYILFPITYSNTDKTHWEIKYYYSKYSNSFMVGNMLNISLLCFPLDELLG